MVQTWTYASEGENVKKFNEEIATYMIVLVDLLWKYINDSNEHMHCPPSCQGHGMLITAKKQLKQTHAFQE